MKRVKLLLFILCAIPGLLTAGGRKDGIIRENGNAARTLRITPGKEWIHSYSALVKVPPQYALWIEDADGNYLKTVYVTKKAATQGWSFSKGERREEALPLWSHRRDIRDAEGVLLPSKKEPLPDELTGATPKRESTIPLNLPGGPGPFRIVLEINHSTDYNEKWPEDAEPGSPGWSGGAGGQPSLIYWALLSPEDDSPVPLTLGGHGSPDGGSGEIYTDMEGFDTALKILDSAVIYKEE